MIEVTECEEIGNAYPPCETFIEACATLENLHPDWREFWTIQQRDNIAESMVQS